MCRLIYVIYSEAISYVFICFTPRCDILTEEISYGKLYRLLLTGYSQAVFNLSKMKKGTGYRNKLTVVDSYVTLDTHCVFKGGVPR